MLAKHVPGMRPNHLVRNAILTLVYFAVFPLILPLVPFYMLYAIGTDRHGIRKDIRISRLNRLPGLTAPGWRGAIAGFLYAMLVVCFFYLMPSPL